MNWPPIDGTLYRPSNGSEGEGFFEGHCYHCKRDAAFQKDMDAADGCPIIAATYAYEVTHEKYPKQWVWKDGAPTCTEFDDVDNEEPPLDRLSAEERAANLELPLEPRA